jgi:hypothetical protein
MIVINHHHHPHHHHHHHHHFQHNIAHTALGLLTNQLFHVHSAFLQASVTHDPSLIENNEQIGLVKTTKNTYSCEPLSSYQAKTQG